LESPYAGVEMWINYKQQVKGERSITLGKAEGLADCAAEEACAWYFEYCSNERNREGEATIDANVEACAAYEFQKDSSAKFAGMKERRYKDLRVRKLNDHSQLYLNVRKLGITGLSDREWRMKCLWKREEDGTVTTVYEDTLDLNENIPIGAGNVVGSVTTTLQFKPLP